MSFIAEETIMLGKERIELRNKEYYILYTKFFPKFKDLILIERYGKNSIFREDRKANVYIYYINDVDNNRIIVVRDDSRNLEELIKRVREAVVQSAVDKFNISATARSKYDVIEYDDGIHIYAPPYVIRDEEKMETEILLITLPYHGKEIKLERVTGSIPVFYRSRPYKKMRLIELFIEWRYFFEALLTNIDAQGYKRVYRSTELI